MAAGEGVASENGQVVAKKEVTAKRGRGRPRKKPVAADDDDDEDCYGIYHAGLQARHFSYVDEYCGSASIHDFDHECGIHDVHDRGDLDDEIVSFSPLAEDFNSKSVDGIEGNTDATPYDVENEDNEPVDFENNGLLWLPPEPEDEEDERETPLFDDDEDEEEDKTKPTITGRGFDIKEAQKVPSSGQLTCVVDITASNRLTHLYVTIDSEVLTEDELAGVGLKKSFDLAYPEELQEGLGSLGFPVADQVIGQKSLEFNITTFVPLLAGLGSGTHKFIIKAVDQNNVVTEETLTLITGN